MQNNVNKDLPIEQRINFLKYCAERYENFGDSPISDTEYDEEYYAIQKLDPSNDFFKSVGGDIGRVDNLVKHDIVMGSLLKARDLTEFEEWYLKTFSNKTVVFCLEPKMDGLALSLKYKDGKLVRAATRGDGEKGMDVTKNALYIKDIPSTIDVKTEVEIRGEVYKQKQDFYKRWHIGVGGEYKNPRAFASGSINQPKNPSITGERELNFVSYKVIGPYDSYVREVELLENNGFKTFEARKFYTCNSAKEAVEYVGNFMKGLNRSQLPFEIDGVVFKLDSKNESEKLGYIDDGRKAKSNIAIKYPPSVAETILIGIEANVGRTGNVTPVGLLKPVELDGSTISRVTLHNYGSLLGGKLKIGSRVSIAKKGDIIPQIVDIIDSNGEPIVFPSVCPKCVASVAWDDTQTNLICTNEMCPAKINKKIEYWFKSLGVKGIGPAIIDRITSKVTQITDLGIFYEAFYNPGPKAKAFLNKEFGEKSAENIIDSIRSINKIPIDLFVQSLGFEQIGKMAKDITSLAGSIEAISNLTISDITALSGFAETKATYFVKSWKARAEEISTILKYISIEKVEKNSNVLDGQSFCFTGSFSNPTRKEMESMVEKNGGKLSSVSKNLSYLVADGEINGSKIVKAKQLGVVVLTQTEFLDKLK
jgi:DNA ligase (NAD+)